MINKLLTTNFKNQPLEDRKPLVTVGITSYNYACFIEAALNSVLNQSYTNIEIVIIDDCSADDCPAIILQWIKHNKLNCTYIQHQNNLGITKTLNEIWSLANGKYITFFATDDIMLPECVERQASELENAGEAYGLCYANALITDEDGSDLGFYNNANSFSEGYILEQFLDRKVCFATPTIMLRKDVYEKAGMFDTRVLIEDYNFFIRLMAIYQVKYCTYPCIIYRLKIKTKSVIHEMMALNNRELFYRDRIISNHQAIRFTTNKVIQSRLRNNIKKALRNLAYNNSQHYYKMLYFLLSNYYFDIPFRTVFSKLKHSFKV